MSRKGSCTDMEKGWKIVLVSIAIGPVLSSLRKSSNTKTSQWIEFRMSDDLRKKNTEYLCIQSEAIKSNELVNKYEKELIKQCRLNKTTKVIYPFKTKLQ